jgi:hypothetical protein
VKTHYSSLETYSFCRSWQIRVLVLSTCVFKEAIIEISKNHNLLIQYPNNTYFSVLEIWNLLENGDKIHFIFYYNKYKWYHQLKVTVLGKLP